jgi:hypothetical protein
MLNHVIGSSFQQRRGATVLHGQCTDLVATGCRKKEKKMKEGTVTIFFDDGVYLRGSASIYHKLKCYMTRLIINV